MSSVVIPPLGPEKSRHLSELIKSKLVALNLYTDDVLLEYIMVLLANGNGRERCYDELSIFMGPEITEQFVIWVFAEAEALLNMETNVPPASVPDAPVAAAATSASVAPYPPANAPVFVPSGDVQMGGTPGAAAGGTRLHGSRSFSRAIESATANTTRPTRTFSMETASEDAASRRRSNRLATKAPLPVMTASRRRVISSASAASEDRGKVQKVRLNVDFDRDERFKNRKRLPAVSKNSASDAAGSPSAAATIKVKCPYWPACRAGEACPNVHPTEPCKHFPNCQFGDACVFLHPSVPCKFQEKCQNPLCNYQHRPLTAMMAASTASVPSTSLSTVQCRFYPRCVNPSCPYLHPVKTECRFGVDCSRADCPFEHANGRKGAHLKTVIYAPCRYGKQCARMDCPFQHPGRDGALAAADTTASASASDAAPAASLDMDTKE